MIHHVSLAVSDGLRSLKFYDTTLATLGYERVLYIEKLPDAQHLAGYGKDGKPNFWIAAPNDATQPDEQIGKARGMHVAFLAHSAQDVDNWYQSCLAAGGTDNGKPGPRAYYHPGYYGAFIIDPDGWRIEACFQNYKHTE
ncbi:VOC family protein [bacterium]|nr:VOC family protein [bacterium]MBT3903355.1 VOC family protein [bacterium]MBT4577818.1 VOC family protein [bacterium]MBT5345452.1 VOC family protein [bacterium]MBT6131146.1 VOC family protein [bacterium]